MITKLTLLVAFSLTSAAMAAAMMEEEQKTDFHTFHNSQTSAAMPMFETSVVTPMFETQSSYKKIQVEMICKPDSLLEDELFSKLNLTPKLEKRTLELAPMFTVQDNTTLKFDTHSLIDRTNAHSYIRFVHTTPLVLDAATFALDIAPFVLNTTAFNSAGKNPPIGPVFSEQPISYYNRFYSAICGVFSNTLEDLKKNPALLYVPITMFVLAHMNTHN